jgi:hypothetical protein
MIKIDIERWVRDRQNPGPGRQVSATVGSSHSRILRDDSPAVARAVRELAARGRAVGRDPTGGVEPPAAFVGGASGR